MVTKSSKKCSDPCTYVIYGATGNLSQLKLMPALFHLEQADRLHENTRIIGIGRRHWTQASWVEQVKQWVEKKARGGLDQDVFQRFADKLEYFEGDLNEDTSYNKLKTFLGDVKFSDNIAFYLSISPSLFGAVVEHLSRVELLKQDHGWRRIVIEKPFGYDLESAQALQARLMKHMSEDQIFRIDHYLGKGTVQNVLVFRFANLMMEPLWNRNYIDHIQITHSETIGVGKRAGYYDGAGALRDMVQSHLLQLLTLVAMEPPVSMEAEALRDEKVKVLRSVRQIPRSAVHAHAFRGQYACGLVDGKREHGYLEEPDIPENSVTETYTALKLFIDNWRWRGVPFYLRTGKRMKRSQSSISICFRHPPQQFFRDTQLERMKQNWIHLGIQPEECLRMEMTSKVPGLEMNTRAVSLDASFRRDTETTTDAYEDLLLDVIQGDRSLFLRYDEVEWAWKVVEPVLNTWSQERDFIHTYPAGSWGPEESSRLFEKECQNWRQSLNTEDDDEN